MDVLDLTSLGHTQLLAFPCQPASFGTTYPVSLPATSRALEAQMRIIQRKYATANPQLTASPFEVLTVECNKPPAIC